MQNSSFDNSFGRKMGAYVPNQISYIDDSIARQNEILWNLKWYLVEQPDLFKDKETYRKNFNYDKRSLNQQLTLDTFWNMLEDQQRAEKESNKKESIRDAIKRRTEVDANKVNNRKKVLWDLLYNPFDIF